MRRLAVSILVLSALSVLAVSCATVVRAPADLEPERFLPPGALAYVRLDGPTLALALARASGTDVSSTKDIAARTDSMTAALVREDSPARYSIVAVAEGRYPSGAASIGLARDRAWRKNGAVWEQKEGFLRLAFVDGGRAFVGTGSIDGLLAAAATPNPNPIPVRWSDEWNSAVALYLPNPIALLSAQVPMGEGEVPMLALVLSATPSGAADIYTTTLRFQFGSDRAALIFSPLCRVFLYAAAHAMWPERAATVLDEAIWSIEGDTVTAAGLPLDADSLSSFVASTGL
ncbi:MAG: hypothetical protein JXM71_13000 [Spirochaetales bacterium]|nr:hypothetical protein [Spirochaetales bacterium]